MTPRYTRRAFICRSGQALAGLALWRLLGLPAADAAGAAPAAPPPLTAARSPLVRVIAIGGAGVHAVARMVEQGITGAGFCFADTNVQPAFYLPGTHSLLLGPDLARGLGSGGKMGLGQAAALASEPDLRAMLAGTELAVLVAGLGGGTGGGAGPVIARLAREAGATTVALVTMPFYFEGRRRHESALAGLEALQAAAGAVLVLPADGLIPTHRHSPLLAIFQALDGLLWQATRSLVELVTVPGPICVDPDSLRLVLSGAGPGRLGLGQAGGAHAARRAAVAALASPFLCGHIDAASGAVLSVRGGANLTTAGVLAAGEEIARVAHPYANLLCGATVDPTLPEGRVEVTLFTAAGSPGRSRSRRP